MKSLFKLIAYVLGAWFTINVSHAQTIRVIDQKGTPKVIDNSKWQLSGTDIYYKFAGNIGIGTNNPSA